MNKFLILVLLIISALITSSCALKGTIDENNLENKVNQYSLGVNYAEGNGVQQNYFESFNTPLTLKISIPSNQIRIGCSFREA